MTRNESNNSEVLSHDFQKVVSDNFSPIYSLCYRMVRNSADAEDLTQEVFIKFHSSHATLKDEKKIAQFLYRIAYNKTIDFIRRKKGRVTINEEICQEHSQESSYTEEQFEKLDAATAELPAQDQFLLALFYKENKSIEEIALIMGQSPANIKVRLHRVRKKLYELLKVDYHEE